MLRMKINYLTTRLCLISFAFFCIPLYADNKQSELEKIYIQYCTQPSDINEHIPVLRSLAQECSSVVEIGVRGMVSTWGVLLGLSENNLNNRSYLGIDINLPPWGQLAKSKELARLNDITFDFWQENDMNIQIPKTDLLFIDSLHTYCHLTYELEKFSPSVSKYIAMHDTSDPWGNRNDIEYQGDYSEYPEGYSRTKKGLWPAVEDFLDSHPEWVLHERLFNNHGFTILKRVESEVNDLSLSKPTIEDKYQQYCNKSDNPLYKHLPRISELAKECSHVTEIGVKSMGLTWSILKGLMTQAPSVYLGIGPRKAQSIKELNLANDLASENEINFTYWHANDLWIQIEPTDLLLLNTFHTYCHLTYELKNFAKNVSKYICIFHTKETETLLDDPLYKGNYSEFPKSYDKRKKGVRPAIEEFLEENPEWNLLEKYNEHYGLTILKRNSDDNPIERINDPEVQYYLDNKIILCTGPSLNRYDMLKDVTEADLSLINFKKIFISTNDSNILGIRFNKRIPDGCLLLKNQGKQLDCLNCILTTMKAAVNDPEVLDDDILMFKHETVFINDMNLIKRIIRKMIDGTDLITRTGMFGPCTDLFFIKVSAVREIVQDCSIVTKISYSCEQTFKEMIVNAIPNAYNDFFHHSQWRFTQLGGYHFYPNYGDFNSEKDGWNKPWWNKSNYEQLFK